MLVLIAKVWNKQSRSIRRESRCVFIGIRCQSRSARVARIYRLWHCERIQWSWKASGLETFEERHNYSRNLWYAGKRVDIERLLVSETQSLHIFHVLNLIKMYLCKWIEVWNIQNKEGKSSLRSTTTLWRCIKGTCETGKLPSCYLEKVLRNKTSDSRTRNTRLAHS